ncbi:FkbM family methyltransferase [Limnobacter parvus]|uniref:FkbM family methyltransferase n=1 Tax=Limnobacter parvus TaxID=2939690 RepID=A0ABT1XFZ3_9BURK|nr:FkbM family methyltransferase [Limnobacter parvus]MCR2745217.1 FkbM family methyltransferase [Limnobacter parvus]
MKRLINFVGERYPTLALLYRNSRDLLDQRRPPRDTQWGFSLAGHDAMASGAFEKEETAMVRKLLPYVDVLVNVGANVGYYCCHALSLGKPVVAVEPNLRNLYYLLLNIRNNGWSNRAEVFPVALGSSTEILQMWGGGTGASLVKGWANIPENYVTQVPVLSLDRILGDTLRGKKALMMVDVEGAEWMMLQGAKQVLANNPRPIWLLEVSFNEHQPAGININPTFDKTFELFFANGYRAVTADTKAMPVTQKIIDGVMTGEYKLETHNFLFVDKNINIPI